MCSVLNKFSAFFRDGRRAGQEARTPVIMFWKVAGFSTPSPVEQILDKQDFTLEELLDEEDMIQECKSLNGRLVAL